MKTLFQCGTNLGGRSNLKIQQLYFKKLPEKKYHKSNTQNRI